MEDKKVRIIDLYSVLKGENLVLALRPDKAAAALDVSELFLRLEIKRGKLKAVRKGRGKKKIVMVPVEAIVEYLQSSEEEVEFVSAGRLRSKKRKSAA
jgi:hypothetical protein